MTQEKTTNSSRRDFLRNSSLLVAGGTVLGGLSNVARAAHSYGTDTIKIGLVGCGGRGTGAAIQAMNTSGGEVKLVAMGDVFPDRAQASYRSLKSQHSEKVDLGSKNERIFTGFDAFKGVLQSDIDMVILATPPGFRPLHVEAAIKAGKHVFMEKPVATDAPGVRRVLEATKLAKEKNLALAVGLQRRHERAYMETVKRLQDGAIGDIHTLRVYWNSGGVWHNLRQDNQTELEYQMRNWYYFNWLCGDHIVEQHIHNLDVGNWVKNGYPVSANGMGGRQVRTGKEFGQIFDHHFVEYDFGGGCRMYSQCRHVGKAWNSVSEHAAGTLGSCDISGAKIYDAKGQQVWGFGGGGRDGHQQEHHDLFASLRRGEIPNEGEYGALSTMTSILGRLVTYSGQVISWDRALNSNIALADFDNLAKFSDEAPIKPNAEGWYEVPTPGSTITVEPAKKA